jgi:hypothetical protein
MILLRLPKFTWFWNIKVKSFTVLYAECMNRFDSFTQLFDICFDVIFLWGTLTASEV